MTTNDDGALDLELCDWLEEVLLRWCETPAATIPIGPNTVTEVILPLMHIRRELLAAIQAVLNQEGTLIPIEELAQLVAAISLAKGEAS